MRYLDEIIVHCSDTKPLANLGVDDINRWHRLRGFDSIGYHFVIKVDGTIESGRLLRQIGAHCKGHNRNSIGICYIGGRDYNGQISDTRTDLQKRSFVNLISSLLHFYPTITKIVGHNYYNKNKNCPCFDAAFEYNKLLTLKSTNYV